MAEQTPFPHLEIINPKFGPASSSSPPRYHFFSKLPPELRCKIWNLALRKERLLSITLRTRLSRVPWVRKAFDDASDDGDHERCITCVTGHQIHSVLLRINQESRREALRFYRVRIPVVFTDFDPSSDRQRKGLLCMNPEFDILQISPEWPVRGSLVEFLFRMKTMYDPLRVGLLNLAIDLNGIRGTGLSELDLAELPPEVRRAFIETMTQLQQVFFVSLAEVGRTMFGWSSGQSDKTFFNRSIPIMSAVPTFERLRQDPRPISQDLQKVFAGLSDPRDMPYSWFSCLRNWCISPQKTVEYRFLLAYVGYQQPRPQGYVRDRASAEKMLHKEDRLWRSLPEPGEDEQRNSFTPAVKPGPGYPSAEQIASEDLDKAVRPAIGFWLFPRAAMGPFPDDIKDGNWQYRPHRYSIIDMSAHPPELCLCDLF